MTPPSGQPSAREQPTRLKLDSLRSHRVQRQGQSPHRADSPASAGEGIWCRWLVAVLVFTAAALPPAAAARAQARIGDIEVFVQPLPAMDRDARSSREHGVSHRYVEYRVHLKNSSTKDHRITLVYPPDERYRSRDSVVVSRTVDVLGGQETSVSLFDPPSGGGAMSLGVRVKGAKDPLEIPVGDLREWRGSTGTGVTPSAVLLSRGVPQDFLDRAAREAEKAKEEKEKREKAKSVTTAGMPGMTTPVEEAASPADRLSLLRSEVPVSQWSPNWLGYSCYDAILLNEDEAQQMPAPAQAAVRRYVECGGMLLVHGRKVPDVFSRGGAADGRGGYHVGLGRAVTSADGGEPDWDKTATMRILATLDDPTDGNAYVNGVSVVDDPERARRFVGFMPDALPAHRDMTIHEYLDFFARAYGLRGAKRRAVVDRVEQFTSLRLINDKPLPALSKGMKQRVSLARALVHDPPVLVLDDAQARAAEVQAVVRFVEP